MSRRTSSRLMHRMLFRLRLSVSTPPATLWDGTQTPPAKGMGSWRHLTITRMEARAETSGPLPQIVAMLDIAGGLVGDDYTGGRQYRDSSPLAQAWPLFKCTITRRS